MNTTTSTNSGTSTSPAASRDAADSWLDRASSHISPANTGWAPAGRGSADTAAATITGGHSGNRHPRSEDAHEYAGYGYPAGPGRVDADRAWPATAVAAVAGTTSPARRIHATAWSDAGAALARLLALPALLASAVGALVVLHRYGALDGPHRPPLLTVLAQVLGLALAQLAAAVLALWALARAARRAGAAGLALLANAVDIATGSKRRRARAATASTTTTVRSATARTAPVVTVTVLADPRSAAAASEAFERSVALLPPWPAPPCRRALPSAPSACPVAAAGVGNDDQLDP